MNYPPQSKGVSSRHSGKPKGLIRNLDSRFRGNDRHAPRGGVLNPGYAIKKNRKTLIWELPILVLLHGVSDGI